MKADELGDEIHLRRMQIVKQDERIIYFNDEPFAKDGKYDKQTGIATYIGKDYVFPLNKFTMLHLTTNLTSIHWFIVLYGILLVSYRFRHSGCSRQRQPSFAVV